MKTDAQLQGDVHDELKCWPSLDAAHLGVVANDGVVALHGRVSHYTEKQAAEDAAKIVDGVKGIVNNIIVELPRSSKRTDPDIAEAALNAMRWDFEVPKQAVRVRVQNGWITLEGTADWQYQKDASACCVRYLMGVVGVSNQIHLKPRANRAT